MSIVGPTGTIYAPLYTTPTPVYLTTSSYVSAPFTNTYPPGSDGLTGLPDLSLYFNLNLPIGTILMYAGTELPANYLWCDGSGYSNDSGQQYFGLYNAIKYAYGIDTALGYFLVPDLRQRLPIGSASTSTPGINYNNGVTGSTGVYGGDTTISTNQMPSHSHGTPLDSNSAATLSYGVFANSNTGGPRMGTANANDLFINIASTNDVIQYPSTGNAGGSSSFIPQYCALNYIIKFN